MKTNESVSLKMHGKSLDSLVYAVYNVAWLFVFIQQTKTKGLLSITSCGKEKKKVFVQPIKIQ